MSSTFYICKSNTNPSNLQLFWIKLQVDSYTNSRAWLPFCERSSPAFQKVISRLAKGYLLQGERSSPAFCSVLMPFQPSHGKGKGRSQSLRPASKLESYKKIKSTVA
ncbi:MAG TPA: hypothetical protein DIS88_07340 [Prevotella sp.]|nr:hypothetical protein [Prevotella sp.]